VPPTPILYQVSTYYVLDPLVHFQIALSKKETELRPPDLINLSSVPELIGRLLPLTALLHEARDGWRVDTRWGVYI
jgi:hypothetical protein